jgi:hypothetical protein
MIGNFDLPIAKSNAKTYIFTNDTLLGTTGGSVNYGMPQWSKPKGTNFIYGLIIGAGSGGGGGYSMGAGTTGGGGGGGTPGGIIQFIQPSYLVPDTLYVTVGVGGAGGAAGNAGGFSTNLSGLWYQGYGVLANTTTRTYYAFANSSMSGAQSGGAGLIAAGGAGGTAATLSTISNQPGIMGLSNWLQPSALTGFAGTLIAGTDATFAGRANGGAGGGGVTSGTALAGGNVLGPTTSGQSIWSRNLSGGPNTGTSAQRAGENGITLFDPTFFSLPGAGGGANASGTGGAGGKGGIGCGGGGGGAGTTGGAGGDGGDGLVILVCW